MSSCIVPTHINRGARRAHTDERYRQGINRWTHRLIIETYAPSVRFVYASENLDERRLACAVLAKQRVNFAPPHVEINMVKRQRSGEALGEASDVEKSGRRCAAIQEHLRFGHLSSNSPGNGDVSAVLRR